MEVKIELLMTALTVTRTMLSRRSLRSNSVASTPCVMVETLTAFDHFVRRVLALVGSHAAAAFHFAMCAPCCGMLPLPSAPLIPSSAIVAAAFTSRRHHRLHGGIRFAYCVHNTSPAQTSCTAFSGEGKKKSTRFLFFDFPLNSRNIL